MIYLGLSQGLLSLDPSKFGVPGTELMQHKYICVPDVLYKYSVCCPVQMYVYHLTFVMVHMELRSTVVMTLAVMILGMPSPHCTMYVISLKVFTQQLVQYP